jgi:iron-sulfur cluster assembly accessory protein
MGDICPLTGRGLNDKIYHKYPIIVGMVIQMALMEQTPEITLTPAAASAVQELLNKRDLTGYALRVYISGGGCSGYQYGMALENNIRDNDMLFEEHGVKMVVDEVSVSYLQRGHR